MEACCWGSKLPNTYRSPSCFISGRLAEVRWSSAVHFPADRTVYLHLHFSNYRKCEARLQAEAKEIAALLEPHDS